MNVEFDKKRKLIDLELEDNDENYTSFTLPELEQLVADAYKEFGLPQKFTNMGVKVWMRFAKSSPFGAKEQTLRNVTEIHYNYPSHLGRLIGMQIAFESDIQQTGVTYLVSYIDEFTTTPETEKAESF